MSVACDSEDYFLTHILWPAHVLWELCPASLRPKTPERELLPLGTSPVTNVEGSGGEVKQTAHWLLKAFCLAFTSAHILLTNKSHSRK